MFRSQIPKINKYLKDSKSRCSMSIVHVVFCGVIYSGADYTKCGFHPLDSDFFELSKIAHLLIQTKKLRFSIFRLKFPFIGWFLSMVISSGNGINF